jgi:hypothetical protein
MDIGTIQNRIKMIEDLEKENRVFKELIDSELENDEEYIESTKLAKEKALERKRAKDKILSKEGMQKTLSDMKANQEEVNTLREILSVELVDFYQKNKIDEIQDANGVLRKFKLSVKLLPQKGIFDDRG